MTWDTDLKASIIDALEEMQAIEEERIEEETVDPAPDIEFDLETYANQILSYFRNYMTMKGDGLGSAVNDVLARGLSEGQSQTEIANKIEDELGVARDRARLIVDTELSRYASRMYQDLSKAAGRDTVVFRAGANACEKVCMPMDGQEFPVSANIIPDQTHPRCECYLEAKMTER